MAQPLNPPYDALFRVKRGLAGYVSYLAACGMNHAFSEYVLYEPCLRILTAIQYEVTCEVPCPGLIGVGQGDKKKIDFVATGPSTFAMEVKWARSQTINVQKDVNKMFHYKAAVAGSRAFLCVFGKKSKIENLAFSAFTLPLLTNANLVEVGTPIYAEFRTTVYGCRIYRLE